MIGITGPIGLEEVSGEENLQQPQPFVCLLSWYLLGPCHENGTVGMCPPRAQSMGPGRQGRCRARLERATIPGGVFQRPERRQRAHWAGPELGRALDKGPDALCFWSFGGKEKAFLGKIRGLANRALASGWAAG